MRYLTTCVLASLLFTGAAWAQRNPADLVDTAEDLLTRCTGSGRDRAVCQAYVRGFSDGHTWLSANAARPTGSGDARGMGSRSVCVPKSERVHVAVTTVVQYLRGRSVSERAALSPAEALVQALSTRYPCR